MGNESLVGGADDRIIAGQSPVGEQTIESDKAGQLAWYLIPASPVIFGLASWPSAWFAQDLWRHYSLPIVAVETIVVLCALSKGLEPWLMIKSMPRWARTSLLVLVTVAIGTSLTVASDRPAAVLRTTSSILHFLFGLSLIQLLASEWQSLRSKIWPYVVVGSLLFCILLVIYVPTIEGGPIEWTRFRLGVTNVRQLGFYSVVGASAALGLAVISGDGRVRCSWVLAAGSLLAISFWSGTRSSLVAFVAAFVVSVVFFPGLRKFSAVASLVVSLVVGLGLSLLHRVPHPAFGFFRLWTSSQAEDPGSGRLEIWLGTWREFWKRPMFGFGESQFRDHVPEALGAYNHPHNVILQILFQWGLVGAICYFSLALALLAGLQKNAIKIGNAALPAYLTMVSLLVYSLYEGTLYHPYPIAMLVVAMAWIWTSGNEMRGVVSAS